jgi:hypothetical protein
MEVSGQLHSSAALPIVKAITLAYWVKLSIYKTHQNLIFSHVNEQGSYAEIQQKTSLRCPSGVEFRKLAIGFAVKPIYTKNSVANPKLFPPLSWHKNTNSLPLWLWLLLQRRVGAVNTRNVHTPSDKHWSLLCVVYTRIYQVPPKACTVNCARSLVLRADGYLQHCFQTWFTALPFQLRVERLSEQFIIC